MCFPNPTPHFGQIPDPKNTLRSFYFPQQQLKLKMKYYYWANANKSTGPYSIPVAILKATKHVISAPLGIIFDASFSTGIVPDLFKIAKVTPVFKKGVQTS